MISGRRCIGDRDPKGRGVRRGFDGDQTRHGGGSRKKKRGNGIRSGFEEGLRLIRGNAILFLKLERENDEEWKCKFRERIRFEIVKWNRLQMETKIEDFDHETP